MADRRDALDLLLRLAPGDLAELLPPRPAWHAKAACRGVGPSAFFPERGESVAPAKAMCSGCTVQAECDEAGQDEQHGIWNGTSARGRRAMRRGAA